MPTARVRLIGHLDKAVANSVCTAARARLNIDRAEKDPPTFQSGDQLKKSKVVVSNDLG